MNNKTTFTTWILWGVYIALLGALLPHTAWAFRQYEPKENSSGVFVSYLLAFTFEASIAVLTHKLAKRIEDTPKRLKAHERFIYRYVNGITFGLVLSTLVSAMANLAHAVQFGQSLLIFSEWQSAPNLYSFAFGGILPLVSLTFANVLSNVVDSEDAPNPELETAKQTIAALRKQVHDTEAKVKMTENKITESEDQIKAIKVEAESLVNEARDQVKLAEARFNAAGDLMRRLFSDDKRERILAIQHWRPQLTGQAIAVIAEASPAYVSEVLKEVQAN